MRTSRSLSETTAQPRKNYNSAAGDRLGQIMDQEKLSGRLVRLIRSRVAAKAVKMLLGELVRELVYSQNPSIESEIEHQELLE
ncbi:hypothetical protein [Microcoleus sp. OTE_8_concoct_300]|uniref:hypothetical protein n=1 Tax=Microcoleus sp. OTE_8_concoct_300 TaxID=2964710 RepID=UPI00403F65E0